MRALLTTLCAMVMGLVSGCATPRQETPLLLQATAWWETGPTNRIVCVPLITNISGEPITVRALTVSVFANEIWGSHDESSLGGGLVCGGEPIGLPIRIRIEPAGQIFTRFWLEDFGTNRAVSLEIECDGSGGYPFPEDSGITWEGSLSTTLVVPPSHLSHSPSVLEMIRTECDPIDIQGRWFRNAEPSPGAYSSKAADGLTGNAQE
jgi:hypothetical protein